MNILEIHGRGALFGGASVHTSMLVEHFSKRENNVVLIYQKGNRFLKDSQFGDNVHKYELDLSKLRLLPINICQILRMIQEYDVDIVHSHHRNADFLTGLVRLFDRKVKAVSTIHGHLRTNALGEKTRYKILTRITKVFLERIFDEVIFISEFAMRANRAYVNKFRKTSVIHNGSSELKATKSADQIKKELGIIRQGYVVTLLANLSGWKRPHLLLKIARILKAHRDIYFLFVGDGEEREKLQQISESEGLNAVFAGWRTDIGNMISASNIVVSTSSNEPFGRTLTEAMMLSKPVIAFDAGGPSEIIQHGVSGYLIKEGDIAAFAKAIYAIYSDKRLEENLADNGRVVAKEMFSDAVFCNKYEKEFKQLV